jgi:integrase
VAKCFTLGIKQGRIFSKPPIPRLQERNVRTGFISGSELRSLCNQLSPELSSVIQFAYITGWRIPSEVLKLEWKDVDFQGGVVRIEPGNTKNQEGRTFPMNEELRDLLLSQRKKSSALCPWVFNRNGKQIKSYRGDWAQATKKSGLVGRIPHDLRRSAVRNFLRAGIPERAAMLLSGHRTRSVFDRYSIVSEADLREAVNKLEQRFGFRNLPDRGRANQNS